MNLNEQGSADIGPLLRAVGIKKSFDGQMVLDGISLELFLGEVVLLRGENGSGKTTLLNVLTGNLEPESGTIWYGVNERPRAYSFPRAWWQELNPWDHFRPEFVAMEGIGRTWQDIRLFGSLLLRENIVVAGPEQPGEKPLNALLFPKRAAKCETRLRARVDDLLARLGLRGRELSSADKISLGQSKRVGIARAITAGAHVLFLDEPIAGLDQKGISSIVSLLASLTRERKITLVIVEHADNQAHLHNLITTEWLLSGAKLECKRDVDRSIRQPGTITRTFARTLRPNWVSHLENNDAIVVDELMPNGASLTRIRYADRYQPDSMPLLEISNLVVRRGPRTVIGDHGDQSAGFNLILREGELAILQAPNGWGKSTLLAAISGMVDITRGEIILKGDSIKNLPIWSRFRRGLRFLPSDRNMFPNLTVREALKLARSSKLLGNLGGLADRVCSSLSGGERQRVGLSITAAGAATTLLDEPFAGLDEAATAQAVSSLRQWESGSILIAIPSLSGGKKRSS